MTRKPIHVAMIIQVYLPHVGGAERQLHSLAPLLQQRHVNVSIITRRLDGLKGYEIIDDVPIYRLPVPGPKALASLAFTLGALPLLWRLKPDIMHAHELLSPTTTAVMAKPLVHAPIVAKVLRGGTLGDLAKLRRKTIGQRRINSFRTHVDTFISISHEITDELEAVGVGTSQRVFIPNGVDTQTFHPLRPDEKCAMRRQLDLPEDVPIVIFTGRLDPEKRIDSLVELWDRIRKRFKGALLLLAGTGTHDEVYKQTSGAGIRFLGGIDNVNQYLQASDVFVLPSTTEGLSNSLLEAMASGLAAIAMHVGGTPDVLDHLHSGYLIRADDREDLFIALTRLLENAELRHKLGEQARQFVQSNYTLETTADRLRHLYDSLLATNA